MEQTTRQSPPRTGGSARAVERTLDLLLAFLREGRELGINDLSRLLHLPKATVHRHLRTLAGRDFVTQNPQTLRYRVGLNAFRLGSLFLAQTEVRQVALPVIHELAKRTGETVNLNVVIDRRRVCLEKAESTQDIRHFVELGRPLPLYSGASGKVLLAYLRPADLDAVIAEGLVQLTPQTITDPRRLRRHLAEIRRRGYAVSSDERVAGASAVSAPIWDSRGAVVAGLTISGPTYRLTGDRVRQYTDLVIKGAARISSALGYGGPSTNATERHPRAVRVPVGS